MPAHLPRFYFDGRFRENSSVEISDLVGKIYTDI